ncbi:hypothetical protein [Actinoplanes subglobosus]|uniref:Lipoprotein n=1 Tax=Actinoplanes subglobosus TaxID=1547892 RepID=A0ABV8J1T4_9ACTN
MIRKLVATLAATAIAVGCAASPAAAYGKDRWNAFGLLYEPAGSWTKVEDGCVGYQVTGRAGNTITVRLVVAGKVRAADKIGVYDTYSGHYCLPRKGTYRWKVVLKSGGKTHVVNRGTDRMGW